MSSLTQPRASLCKEKVDQWGEQNNKLSRKDFESEIKRLNRLLLSYTGLKNVSHTTNPQEKVLMTDLILVD